NFTFGYNNPCSDYAATVPSQFLGTCGNPASPQASLTIPNADLGGGSPICTAPGSFSGTQALGHIKLFGPAGSQLDYLSSDPATFYSSQNVASGQGTCTTTFTFRFFIPGSATLTNTQNVILAWGGHIAWQGDWGQGNTASFISGSPYHMELFSLDGDSTG